MIGRAVIIALALILFYGDGTSAATDILEGADVQADPATVKAIQATFDRAEEALRTENLSGIMTLYSKGYQNRGLRKEDTSRIWEDLFVRYDRLSSRHVFSKIVVDKKSGTAQVTCTGALFGTSVLKREGKPSPTASLAESVQIDSWFEAVHYLVLEDGAWRIIGHDPARGEQDAFGSAIHLLF
jgi:hypothetical protein